VEFFLPNAQVIPTQAPTPVLLHRSVSPSGQFQLLSLSAYASCPSFSFPLFCISFLTASVKILASFHLCRLERRVYPLFFCSSFRCHPLFYHFAFTWSWRVGFRSILVTKLKIGRFYIRSAILPSQSGNISLLFGSFWTGRINIFYPTSLVFETLIYSPLFR